MADKIEDGSNADTDGSISEPKTKWNGKTITKKVILVNIAVS